MRSLLPEMIVLPLLALAIFGAWMHWAVLDPRNVGWLLDGNDRGQSAIGLAAYLRAGHWPSLHQPLLDAPEGLTLLFTDSVPLLGLILGPFAPWLPPELQFIGPWLLLCVMLQVAFAWLLVRPHAPDRLTALLGTALLALMPALINRYGHASLCAQWLILWALWVFVDERRSARPLWWAAVLGLAALVHSYLLLMTAAIWGSAVLRQLSAGPARWRAVAGGLPVAALVVGIAAWHGVFGGSYASTGTYGAFPLALDAWWNPANPTYSALLPSSPEDHGRGFEGLQYLGAGLLFLLIVGTVALASGRGRVVRASLARLPWLLPAFVVIAVVAIGPQPIWRGQPLATFHLPPSWIDALDPVRAAGRMAWPLTYTLAYAAVVVGLRLPRSATILAAALALQVIDLTPMLAAVYATSARAVDRTRYVRTRDARWAPLIASAHDVQLEPAEPFRDLQVAEEIAWRAVAACRPMTYFYASREAQATRKRIDRDTALFRAGQPVPGRLYILLDGRAPASLAAQVRFLDRIAYIAPAGRPAPPGCVSASSPRSAS
jgi:hypothetical protein